MPEPVSYPKGKSETKEEKKKKLSDEEKEHKDEKTKKTKAEKEEKKPKKKRKTEEQPVPPTKKPKREPIPEESSRSPIEPTGEPSPREKQLAEEIKEVLISKGKIQLSELVNIFKPKISGADEKKLFIDIVKRLAKKNGEKYLTLKDNK